MLGSIALVVVALVLFLAVLVGTRPAAFRIERSSLFEAPQTVVFPMVNDFHEWAEWSPWEKRDLGMKKIFDGPKEGVGAKYSWIGNKDVGEGRMTILDSDPPRRVAIKLEFLKPFAATNDTLFTFAPEASGTRVTWTMDGKNNFMAKAFSLFVDMDKMVGGDFEKGLAAMKALAEARTRKSSS